MCGLRIALVLLLTPSCVFVVDKDRFQAPPEQIQHDDRAPSGMDQASPDQERAPMRSYWMGMIKQGPNYFAEVSDADRSSLQAAHLARIGEIAAEGKMILAGPFGPQEGADDPLIGLFLYTVESREEAEALAASDPAVAAGRLRVEIVEWYGVSGITYPGNPVPDAAAISSDG